MKFRLYKKIQNYEVIKSEKGQTLLTVMMMLCLLTIIGLAATNVSNIDMQIASSEKNRQQAFYAAEAGIEHARSVLSFRYSTYNKAAILLNQLGDWDFALDGREAGKSAATDSEKADGLGDFTGGAVWLCNSPLTGNIKYTVTIWNNDDELTPDLAGVTTNDGNAITDDEDGIIYVRSDGFGPNDSRAAIQITMLRGATITAASIQGYDAQAGGGQSKTSGNSTDVNSVQSTQQLQ